MQTSQTRFISQAIRVLNEKTTNYELKQAVDELIAEWEERLLNGWDEEEGWLAAVRAIDVGMAVNRIKGLKIAWKNIVDPNRNPILHRFLLKIQFLSPLNAYSFSPLNLHVNN